MCDPTTMLIASLASTAAGTVLSGVQNRRAQRRQNEAVQAQNRLLEQQFMQRQQKVQQARDEQARVFEDLSDKQDAEFDKQTELAKQKQRVFQDAVSNPEAGATADALKQAAENRMSAVRANTAEMPADYLPRSTGSTENRVLRMAGDKAREKEGAKTDQMLTAASTLAAQGDVGAGRNRLFRDLNVGLNTIASDATASMRLADMNQRAPRYRMGALDAVIGDTASAPYFRGDEPVLRMPDPTLSGLLQGAGQLGATYAFMGGGGGAAQPYRTAIGPTQRPFGGFYGLS